jgi:hypothetical protein
MATGSEISAISRSGLMTACAAPRNHLFVTTEISFGDWR